MVLFCEKKQSGDSEKFIQIFMIFLNQKIQMGAIRDEYIMAGNI